MLQQIISFKCPFWENLLISWCRKLAYHTSFWSEIGTQRLIKRITWTSMEGTRTYRNGLLYVMEELNLADFYRLLHPNTKTCTCESKSLREQFRFWHWSNSQDWEAFDVKAKLNSVCEGIELLKLNFESLKRSTDLSTKSGQIEALEKENTVDHTVLLSKSSAYGIQENAYNWFKSYLENRTQTCSVSGSLFKICSLQCGIPQGAVLGPLFFAIHKRLTKLLN